MCTHAASERERQRERQRERREDRPVTNPIRISVRGIDNAQLPVMFGYRLHPGTNRRGSCERTASGYQLCSVSDLFGCHRGEAERPVTNYVRYQTCSVAIEGKQSVRLPVTNPSDQGNGTPKNGQAGRRFRRLLRRASNPSHWRVVLYRFFGGKVRVSAFWRSLYHRPFSSAGQHFFAFSIHRFRNF
jgi:hypothetical protein